MTFPRRQVTVSINGRDYSVKAGIFQDEMLDVGVLVGQDILEDAIDLIQVQDLSTLRCSTLVVDEQSGSKTPRRATEEPGPIALSDHPVVSSRKGGPPKRKRGSDQPVKDNQDTEGVVRTGKADDPKGELSYPDLIRAAKPEIEESEAASELPMIGINTRSTQAEPTSDREEEEETPLPAPEELIRQQRQCPTLEKSLQNVDKERSTFTRTKFALDERGVLIRITDPDYPQAGVEFGEGPRTKKQIVVPKCLA